MLVLAGVVHHLRDFGFGDLVGENTAFADAMLMDMQHDPRRFFRPFVEIFAQHGDDKFHRRVVVVEQQHAIHTGASRLRFGARDNSGAAARCRVTAFLLILGRLNGMP